MARSREIMLIGSAFAIMATGCKKSADQANTGKGYPEKEQPETVVDGESGSFKFPHVVYGFDYEMGGKDKCLIYEQRDASANTNNVTGYGGQVRFDLKWNDCDLQATLAKDIIGLDTAYWREVIPMGPPNPTNPENQFTYMAAQTINDELKTLGVKQVKNPDNPAVLDRHYTMLPFKRAETDDSAGIDGGDGYAEKITFMLVPDVADQTLDGEVIKKYFMVGKMPVGPNQFQMFCLKFPNPDEENVQFSQITALGDEGFVIDAEKKKYVFTGVPTGMEDTAKCARMTRRLNKKYEPNQPQARSATAAVDAGVSFSQGPSQEPTVAVSLHKFMKAGNGLQCLAFDRSGLGGDRPFQWKNCVPANQQEVLVHAIQQVGSMAALLEWNIQVQKSNEIDADKTKWTTGDFMAAVRHDTNDGNMDYVKLEMVSGQNHDLFGGAQTNKFKIVYDMMRNIMVASVTDLNGAVTEYCVTEDNDFSGKNQMYRVSDGACTRMEIVDMNAVLVEDIQ